MTARALGGGLVAALAAAALAVACAHPHPHPAGPPTSTGPATPVEPTIDAGAPAPADAELEGGFGYAPDASPGEPANPCGNAQGTIGTGRYGTISHGCGGGYAIGGGSGTIGHGSGYGVGGGGACGGRRSGPVPSIKMGQPIVHGSLDKAIVRRYVKRHSEQFLYCYEKALLVKPDLVGDATLAYTIKPDGTVRDQAATGLDPDVDACLTDFAKDIEYPKPPNGDAVTVTVTFTYAPTS